MHKQYHARIVKKLKMKLKQTLDKLGICSRNRTLKSNCRNVSAKLAAKGFRVWRILRYCSLELPDF